VQYDVLWSTEKQYWPRPKSILFFSTPQHIILHEMKCYNCFITFNIPIFVCVLDRFLRIVCWFFFKFKSTISWFILYQRYLYKFSAYKFILLIRCVQIYICILLALVKLLYHILFVWRHCKGRRKRLASKFLNFTGILPTTK